ncbi:MAG: hypothetical protein IPN62_16880 [Flavobacteriales bacterium]|nr:hypothetical protein [Flavobacteriales bacterium]
MADDEIAIGIGRTLVGNHDLFLEVIRQVSKAGTRIRAFIVGDGENGNGCNGVPRSAGMVQGPPSATMASGSGPTAGP